MSYHRDWEWDEPSDSRQVTIKRYVIPDERDRDHDDFMSRPDYGERGMVVRRHERHHDYDDRKYLHPNRTCPYSQSMETLRVEHSRRYQRIDQC